MRTDVPPTEHSYGIGVASMPTGLAVVFGVAIGVAAGIAVMSIVGCEVRGKTGSNKRVEQPVTAAEVKHQRFADAYPSCRGPQAVST